MSEIQLWMSSRPATTVPIPEGARWRVVWHDGSEQDEVRGLLRLEDLTEVLASGP